MYKKSLYSLLIISNFLLLFIFSCSGEKEVNPVEAPTNITLSVTIVGADNENPNGDGSGMISIIASATNATTFSFDLGDGFSIDLTSGFYNHTYSTLGSQDFTVKVTASNTTGSISSTKQITVIVDPYLGVKNKLSGTSSKVWFWNQTKEGHIGSGPISSFSATDFSASENELSAVGCIYDDEITFSKDNNGGIIFTLDNMGSSYFNKDEVNDALGSSNPTNDDCYNYSTSDTKIVSFSNSVSGILNSTQIDFTLEDNGFMSYYLGSNSYEILAITDTTMSLRVIQDIDGVKTAWYHSFTTIEPPDVISFNQLIWSDEFDTAGKPNTTNWGYDIGTGSGGWGNNESQYYTSRTENVEVKDGKLIITAKKESYGGMNYTSTRLLSQNKFSFKYGRVEVSAKLPGGKGIWPAIWMLGDNFATQGWPACGEIDIMEHVGYEPTKIHGTIHNNAGSGGNGSGDSKIVSDCEDAFHVYAIEWDYEKIKFMVDDEVYYTYKPSAYNANTWPFDEKFFLILNVAVGGNWAGSQGIDDSIFPQSMEIEYVRVYQ